LTSGIEEDPMHDANRDGKEAAMTRDRLDEDLRRIERVLRGLRFGTVSAVVQDGVVVLLERTERIRLARPGSRA
jgi:hypothetical protein